MVILKVAIGLVTLLNSAVSFPFLVMALVL